MLGVMVAKEVQQLDHEKQCSCLTCGVGRAIREINMFNIQNECGCPVCMEAKNALFHLGSRLNNLFKKHVEDAKRAEPIMKSLIRTPEHEEQLRILAAMQGSVAIGFRLAQRQVEDYKRIVMAAHAAYEIVAANSSFEIALEGIGRRILGAPPSDHNMN
jgi:hypothetical protein